MFSCLLLGTALLLGQVASEEKPAETAPAAPASDRWLLMKALQGTWEGALLDGSRQREVG
jgi:hypothetical protein